MMKTLVLVGAAALLIAPAAASPLMPVTPAQQLAVQSDDLVLVKAKARPHGWSRGRKVGWRGGKVPPGHQKRR